MCDVVCSFSGVLLGAFLGAVLGALFGWWLTMREHERDQYRRTNLDHLQELGRAAVGYLTQAAGADPDDIDFIARQVRGIGALHMRGNEDSFTVDERQALSKFSSDLETAVNAIGAAPDHDRKVAEYDKWTAILEGHSRVLWRHIYDYSAPGLGALFRSY